MYQDKEIFYPYPHNSLFVSNAGDKFLVLAVLYKYVYSNCVGGSEIAMYAYGQNNGDKQMVKQSKLPCSVCTIGGVMQSKSSRGLTVQMIVGDKHVIDINFQVLVESYGCLSVIYYRRCLIVQIVIKFFMVLFHGDLRNVFSNVQRLSGCQFQYSYATKHQRLVLEKVSHFVGRGRCKQVSRFQIIGYVGLVVGNCELLF
eukprot:TRINITY_DN3130_c1_g1_i2.p2 TRINITY_DN3130_c1_g1~~TRINITY_DN3130_c1_g1_i2.p2  ORF type:complete len:200 (-),score=2.18 TRINITY_DN3130_c1_g1_i2:34-633(-)